MQAQAEGAFDETEPIMSDTEADVSNGEDEPRAAEHRHISYKFQRLREALREAVESGEWVGKLPGERALARRFGVNAKTLSKALTDLAAEGLLERRVGRGTFVAGSMASEGAGLAAKGGRWLVICDQSAAGNALLDELKRLNPACRVVEGTEALRPSFLSNFSVVLDCGMATPAAFYRRMRVRGLPVVTLCAPDREITSHMVRLDRTLAGFCLGRDLLLAGHRRLAAVGDRRRSELRRALAQAVGRYAKDATVDEGVEEDVLALVDQGITGIVCDGIDAARRVLDQLGDAGVDVPQRVSVAAIGLAQGELSCSGNYVKLASVATALVEMLKDLPPHPVVSWLRGHFVDRGTMGCPPHIKAEEGGGPCLSDSVAS